MKGKCPAAVEILVYRYFCLSSYKNFTVKVFTSKKALNGHMRFHAQKGITNPPTAPPSSFAQSHDDQFLPPKKRQALKRKRYMDIDDEGTAAETLLHISHEGYEGSTANIDVNHNGARQNIPRKMDTEGTLLCKIFLKY
jgi:hypothetical protein